MPFKFKYDSPLLPDEFLGRGTTVKRIMERLLDPAMAGSCITGGPRSGKTSLMRHLEHKLKQRKDGGKVRFIPVYFPCTVLGHTERPEFFWAWILKEVVAVAEREQLPALAVLRQRLEQARQGNIAQGDLVNTFDELARQKLPVVVLIDDSHLMLRNMNFWPPHNFFHHLRFLLERQERGFSMVLTCYRLIHDIWDSSKGASPFYNTLLTFYLGQLTAADASLVVKAGFKARNLELDDDVKDLILEASERHPCLINYAGAVCADCLQNREQLTGQTLERKWQEADSVPVMLMREIRSLQTNYQRQLVERAIQSSGELTSDEREELKDMMTSGLLEPGLLEPGVLEP